MFRFSTLSMARYLRTCSLMVAVALPCFATQAAYPASAMVVRGGEVYEVAQETTLEGDLYYVGKTLSVRGTSTDDVSVLGSTSVFSGHVGGDILAFGGTVVVGGTVKGDARMVGGELTVASTTVVREDVVALGGTITVEEGAVIKGDLLVYGDRLVLDGTVEGNVEAHVRSVEMKGVVGHDTNLTARETISITEQAHLKGPLSYSAPHEAFISDTVTLDSETSFEFTAEGSGTSFNILPALLRFLIALVAALLLIFLLPRFSTRTSRAILEGSGMLALKGFVLFLAWPLAGIVLCVTVLGAIPGILLLTSFVFMALLSFALTPVVAGVVLARWLKKENVVQWDWTVLGAVCLSLIVFLPFIGFFVGFVLFVATFGGLTFSLLAKLRTESPFSAPTPTLTPPGSIDTPVVHTHSHETTPPPAPIQADDTRA